MDYVEIGMLICFIGYVFFNFYLWYVYLKQLPETEWKPELKVQPLQYTCKFQEQNEQKPELPKTEKTNFYKEFNKLPTKHKLVCTGLFLFVIGIIGLTEEK